MGRKILFKAKRKDNNEQVEGYYMADPDLDQHEQYCKKFLKKTEIDLEYDSYHQKKLLELEKMIKEYEESRGIKN